MSARLEGCLAISHRENSTNLRNCTLRPCTTNVAIGFLVFDPPVSRMLWFTSAPDLANSSQYQHPLPLISQKVLLKVKTPMYCQLAVKFPVPPSTNVFVQGSLFEQFALTCEPSAMVLLCQQAGQASKSFINTSKVELSSSHLPVCW